jgi:hypothetical protein
VNEDNLYKAYESADQDGKSHRECLLAVAEYVRSLSAEKLKDYEAACDVLVRHVKGSAGAGCVAVGSLAPSFKNILDTSVLLDNEVTKLVQEVADLKKQKDILIKENFALHTEVTDLSVEVSDLSDGFDELWGQK